MGEQAILPYRNVLPIAVAPQGGKETCQCHLLAEHKSLMSWSWGHHAVTRLECSQQEWLRGRAGCW